MKIRASNGAEVRAYVVSSSGPAAAQVVILPHVRGLHCMGGSLSFYAGTLGLSLNGVIGFYAGLTRARGAVTPALGFVDRIEAPLLGLFGGADQGIPRKM